MKDNLQVLMRRLMYVCKDATMLAVDRCGVIVIPWVVHLHMEIIHEL